MEKTQKQPNQLELQVLLAEQDFQNVFTAAANPLNGIIKAFNVYKAQTQALLGQKDAEIQELKVKLQIDQKAKPTVKEAKPQ